jgi:hypothetical protein
MVVRIVLATGLAVTAMGMVANGTALQRVGLTSSCAAFRAGTVGSQLESCRAGWLNGYPNLASRGCTTVDRSGKTELWSCPVR